MEETSPAEEGCSAGRIENLTPFPDDTELSDEDLRAALSEMKTYVDVTEDDLRKIYILALRHARERLAFDIPVGNVMVKDVITAGQDTCIGEVIRIFSEKKISGLPVVDDKNCVIGVVSEADVLSMTGMKRGHTFSDLVRHILGEPLPRRRAGNLVADIMSSPAITITSETGVRQAAKILDEKKIKRLPVVDAGGRLLGIISRADIVKVMSRQ